MKNAGDEKQVKEAGKKAKDIRMLENEDMRKVLNTREGRNVLWRVMVRCGTFAQDFVPNNSITSFREGQRKIGLYLKDEIEEADQEAFFKMMREQKEDREDAKGS